MDGQRADLVTGRAQLLSRAAERLQAAYAARRVVESARVEQLRAAGAFRAPEHLVPGLRGDLGLPTPLVVDEIRAEAA